MIMMMMMKMMKMMIMMMRMMMIATLGRDYNQIMGAHTDKETIQVDNNGHLTGPSFTDSQKQILVQTDLASYYFSFGLQCQISIKYKLNCD